MDLELKIRIVLLMAKFESPTEVLRRLKSEGYKDVPTTQYIGKLYSKFCEFGTVLDLLKSGRPKISDEDSTRLIEEILEEDPKSTIRAISKQTNLSVGLVQSRISKEIGLKPYKIQFTQELFDEDFDKRVEMAEILIPILQNPANKNMIFFSDEANFYLSGLVNKQNCRIWGYEKPLEVWPLPLHSPKINVWCAISANCIIGPYFFEEETVTGENYLEMLKEFFHPILIRKRIVRRVIFQQDGAPPHYAKAVRAWLNKHFPGKWIGRRGAIEWAPRSPDLTPCDFFLWGYLKQKVYMTPVKDLNELKQRITDYVHSIEPELLKRVFLNIEKRLDKVKEENGGYIEHLL
jgi:hypothetical protein